MARTVNSMDNAKIKEIYNALIIGIKDYFKKNNFKKAAIGLSGGLDSALCAKLAADSIGKQNLKALIMPVKGLSSEKNIKDAVELCKWIGVRYYLVYINDFIKTFEKLDWKQNKVAKMNTASRIRAVLLYNYANSNNALVIGTSNKTEILMGYFTKYGDGAVDIEVIGDLFKTDEKELAKFLKIPKKIIDKVPTAELYPGQTDEKEFGISYEKLDKILKLYSGEGLALSEVVSKGFNKKLVNKIAERVKSNEHKRRMPEVIRVPK